MSQQPQQSITGASEPAGHLTDGMSRWATIGVVAGTMMALLLAALDQTIVGTAMPRIIADLNGLNYYAWVVTAYLVASTITVPIAGKLGDLFGRKPFLLAGMIGFVVASALCGQSHNMLELIIFRSIQGLFGGILFATVFAVIGDLLYGTILTNLLTGRPADPAAQAADVLDVVFNGLLTTAERKRQARKRKAKRAKR